MMKSLLIILVLSLAGCGSTAKKPPATAPNAEIVAPRQSTDQLPIDSWKYKIIEAATGEWIFLANRK